jgi:hypothetical protein
MSLPEAKFSPLGPPKLEYTRTINYIFENPNWLMNAVWSFLCQVVAQIIPILPQMVLTGYQFEALDDLLASRGSRYPDFNINRLGDYLGRGVWPILAVLIVALAWTPVVAVVVGMAVVAIIGLAAAVGEDAAPVFVVMGIVVTTLLVVSLLVVLFLVATPFVLRAGITQDLGAAFDLGWAIDFLKKMWLDVVLASLFAIGVSLAVTVLTCGIGALIVQAFAPFVSTHFWYQFYVLYLERGGIPIPVKKVAPQPSPAVFTGKPL